MTHGPVPVHGPGVGDLWVKGLWRGAKVPCEEVSLQTAAENGQ